jgi:hypothetical protein
VDDFTATVERMRSQRAALIATLPCASCEIDSESAQACKVYDQTGCKHLPVLLARRETDERIQNRRSNLIRAGIAADVIEEDERIKMVLRDSLEPWKAVHAVRRALASKSLRFLVLGGDHRAGKTLALIYACAVRAKALYIRAQQLGRISQDTQRWIETEILCVNELGREHLGNGFTASNLDELMAEREYGRKLTIFATNLSLKKRKHDDASEPPALTDRYGDLFASRIVGSSIGAYVVCEPGAMAAGPAANNPTSFNERAEK